MAGAGAGEAVAGLPTNANMARLGADGHARAGCSRQCPGQRPCRWWHSHGQRSPAAAPIPFRQRSASHIGVDAYGQVELSREAAMDVRARPAGLWRIAHVAELRFCAVKVDRPKLAMPIAANGSASCHWRRVSAIRLQRFRRAGGQSSCRSITMPRASVAMHSVPPSSRPAISGLESLMPTRRGRRRASGEVRGAGVPPKWARASSGVRVDGECSACPRSFAMIRSGSTNQLIRLIRGLHRVGKYQTAAVDRSPRTEKADPRPCRTGRWGRSVHGAKTSAASTKTDNSARHGDHMRPFQLVVQGVGADQRGSSSQLPPAFRRPAHRAVPRRGGRGKRCGEEHIILFIGGIAEKDGSRNALMVPIAPPPAMSRT